jgi:hypothetical protein
MLTTQHPLSAKVGTGFSDRRRSLGRYSSLTDQGHGFFCFCFYIAKIHFNSIVSLMFLGFVGDLFLWYFENCMYVYFPSATSAVSDYLVIYEVVSIERTSPGNYVYRFELCVPCHIIHTLKYSTQNIVLTILQFVHSCCLGVMQVAVKLWCC